MPRPHCSATASSPGKRAGLTFARCGSKFNCSARWGWRIVGVVAKLCRPWNICRQRFLACLLLAMGFEPILQLARTNYLMGEVYGSCGEGGKAKSRFEVAAAQVNPDQIVWAYRSAQKLPGFDQREWQQRLESALSRNFSQTSWGYYNRGLINNALGHAADAEADFHRALLMPDGLLAYHLTRLALAPQAR